MKNIHPILRQKKLCIYSKREEHILAEALGRRILALQRLGTPKEQEEIDILTDIMKRFGYRPATEEERYL
jgi:hypothetical protein